MPAPMTQPMPSETRLHAESVRFNGTPPWATKACTSVSSASAWSRAIGFLMRIFGTLSPSRSCSCRRRMVQLSATNNQAVKLRETLLVRWPSTTWRHNLFFGERIAICGGCAVVDYATTIGRSRKKNKFSKRMLLGETLQGTSLRHDTGHRRYLSHRTPQAGRAQTRFRRAG